MASPTAAWGVIPFARWFVEHLEWSDGTKAHFEGEPGEVWHLFSLVGLVVNIISDFIYTMVDPRIDFESRESRIIFSEGKKIVVIGLPLRRDPTMLPDPRPCALPPWRGPKPAPGNPTLPVNPGKQAMARPASQPLLPLCMELPPSTIIAGFVLA